MLSRTVEKLDGTVNSLHFDTRGYCVVTAVSTAFITTLPSQNEKLEKSLFQGKENS